MRPYLEREWRDKKKGSIVLWKRISQFIASKFPDAVSLIDLERSLEIQALRESPNFETTHAAIGALDPSAEFSSPQCRTIAEALIENTQVKWIKDDPDVRDFYQNFLERHGEKLDADLREKVKEIVN